MGSFFGARLRHGSVIYFCFVAVDCRKPGILSMVVFVIYRNETDETIAGVCVCVPFYR